MRAAGIAAAVLAAVTCQGASLQGQQWRVDVSGSSVRYDTSATFGSVAVSPSAEWLRRGTRLGIGGSVASLGQGEWSLQGRAGGSAQLPPSARGPVSALLLAEAGGTAHSSGYETSLLRVEARLVAGRRAGAWAGMAAATGWSSLNAGGSIASWGPAAGAWWGTTPFQVEGIVRSMRIAGASYPELNANVFYEMGRAEMGAFAGWRAAPDGVRSDRWAGGSVSYRWTPALSLFVSGGSYPDELLQGLPGGRFISAGFRLSSPRPLEVLRLTPYRRRGESGELSFAIRGAERVELAGDWTSWERVPLRRAGARWVLKVTLPAGVHRFNLVVDGRWTVPEGVPSAPDGDGGRTGILIVPE